MSETTAIHHAAHVHCRYDPRAWAFADDNRERIDAHWAGLIGAKPALFNGKVLMLHRWSLEGSVFSGGYLMTDYKNLIAWRDFGHPDRHIWNCFAMAALRSADGAFLLGEMGDHTVNGGAIYFAAGTPDPSDLKGDYVDLDGSVLRELTEETGVTPEDVTLPHAWTIVVHGQRIALMRPVVSALSADALKARIETFLASEETPELSRMHIVRHAGDLIEERMPVFQQAYLRHALSTPPQRTG